MRIWPGAIALAMLSTTAAALSEPPRGAPGDEADFVARLKALDNGLVNVAALNLPDSFLLHIADWDIRGSVRSAARKVAADPAPPMPVVAIDALAGQSTVNEANPMLPAALVDQWMQYSFTVPTLPGFRAPLGELASDPWPFDLRQRGDDDKTYRDAATFVAQNLAHDGLLRTTMRLMSRFNLIWTRDDGLNLLRLRGVGVPVDLLVSFTIDGQPAGAALKRWLDEGAKTDAIEALAQRARFEFKPTVAGFAVLAEDASEPVGMLRLQLPSHRYRLGEGDGSVLDVFRQLAQRLPDRPMTVSMHEKALPALRGAIARWNVPNPSRLTFVPHPANLTQWAQDNAKAGIVPASEAAPRSAITLAPRFASRAELRTTFVPSDSLVMETLSRTGMSIRQSPLLFQGGNLLPVVDPRTGTRILLMGEAELYRNIALGLTSSQVQQAFAVEFGVAKVVVLPAVSFHIDLDVTIRLCGADLVACVNDDLAASRIIYKEGLRTLADAMVITPAQAAEYDSASNDPLRLASINHVTAALRPLRDPDGSLGPKFTALFARSALESPAANAQRFLVALDTISAACFTAKDLERSDMPLPLRVYVAALKRQQAARDTLAQRLTELGMRVHRIPGLNDHDVSVNYVNGIHLPGVFLMPTFGGWFEPLDRVAREELQKAFGPSVRIEPILAGMVQENDGGLHCMVGLYPSVP